MAAPALRCLALLCAAAQALPPALQEAPLDPRDIALVLASPGAKTVPSHNASCLLVPAVGETQGCSWRMEQQCRRRPRVVSQPLYSPECHEEGGIHLSGCQERTLERPLLHTVQVCGIVAEKQCMGPCYNCPTFCQPTQQGWCESSHTIRTEVAEEEGGGRLQRVERDVVTATRRCYTKKVEELCANINCKFVNPREECQQRNSSTVAQLRERRCSVCAPRAAERVDFKEDCKAATARDCAGDPLPRPWRKLCGPPGPPEAGRRGGSLEQLLASTLASPVEELVVEALSRIHRGDLASLRGPVMVATGGPGDQALARLAASREQLVQREEQLVEEELQLVHTLQDQAAHTTQINMNVKYEFEAPSPAIAARLPTGRPATLSPNSVYFDQLLLTHLQDQDLQDLQDLQDQDQDQDLDQDQDQDQDLQDQDPLSSPLLLNTRAPAPGFTSASTTTLPTTPTTIQTTTTVSTTTTPVPTTTTATTTTTTTVTTTTARPATLPSPRRRLSPAELLRLCFTRGIGCDFSQNEVEDALVEEALVEPTTTTTTTTARPGPSAGVRARLKERVMRCFFQGICDSGSDDSTPRPSTPRPTTTQRPSTTRRPTARPGSRQQIREKARACFFRGIC